MNFESGIFFPGYGCLCIELWEISIINLMSRLFWVFISTEVIIHSFNAGIDSSNIGHCCKST